MGFYLTCNQIEVLFYVERYGWTSTNEPFARASITCLVGKGLLCTDGHFAHITPLGGEFLHKIRHGL